MNLNIHAYSTALFATWINIEELGVLFDAGDGVTSGLLQKAGKVKYVFITHPDRDHITGLFQFNQLNSRKGFPKIYFPKDCGSFPAMRDFQLQFDPHIKEATWQALVHGDRVRIQNNIYVEAIRNEHIKVAPEFSKSLSFKIMESKQKLKREFLHLKGDEIKNLIAVRGKEALMDKVHTNILSYSGDTPVDDYSKWDYSNILIHEATFLQDEEGTTVTSKGNKHSTLEEVLKMASEITLNRLILSHFSSRYDRETITNRVQKLCAFYGLKIPVNVIYPGQIHRDILNSNPVYEP
ncbi:MBL fold metallo-hydrolase [Spongiimicrobium salis]|uniref:RNAse Z n=1 Tax=Spongiimicrobium salis TaxID=1667022 RepID=UPI00374D0D36